MRIDPALRALRSDPVPQRIAQTALEQAKADWRGTDDNRQILEDLNRFGLGEDLADCPALQRIFAEPAGSDRFVRGLVNPILPQLAAYPLGQIPFRHQYSDGMAIIQIAAARQAAISLVMYERCVSDAVPHTICFTDSERHEIALAGTGRVQIVRREKPSDDRAHLRSQSIWIKAGHSLSLSGTFETKFIERVENQLIILRLSRTASEPLPSLEFRLCDGTLVHRASGNKRDSGHEMMLSLLGRMGRTDAAPVMAEMAREGSDHLRWQALRECLALDTAQGFAALCAVAREPRDKLSGNAAALRAQLIETHPQLAIWENSLCHA